MAVPAIPFLKKAGNFPGFLCSGKAPELEESPDILYLPCQFLSFSQIKPDIFLFYQVVIGNFFADSAGISSSKKRSRKPWKKDAGTD
jgi:hypothetical protein